MEVVKRTYQSLLNIGERMPALGKDTKLVMTILFVGAISGINVYFYAEFGSLLAFSHYSHAIVFGLMTIGSILVMKATFDLALNDYIENNANSTGFPPYNIQKVEDFKYEIEMALAGFDKKDIEIEVADGVLTIRSVKENNDQSDEWTLHRGISYRKFNRKFTLADDIVVNNAKLENGLLTITLEQIVPEEKKPRLISIK